MFKRFTILFSILLMVVALTACPTVGSDPDKSVLNGEIGAGETLTRTFIVPNDLQGDIIYFELDGTTNGSSINTAGISIASKLELTLYDATGKAVRYSNNAKFFSDISNANSISTAGIVVDPKKDTCRGPCIIFEYDPATLISGNGQVKIKVKNNNSSPVKYELFAFIAKYADSNEPNNHIGECKNIVRSSNGVNPSGIGIDPKNRIEVNGAIETVEDVDCFTTNTVVSKVTIETGSENSVGLKAVFRDKDTSVIIDTINVDAGSKKDYTINNKKVYIEIHSLNGKAGPAKYSSYKILY